MIKEQLDIIKDTLEACIPEFSGNGYVIRRGVEQEVKGITDTIPNYFYLDYVDGSEQMTFEGTEGAKSITEATIRCKLIARTSGFDVCSVGKAIAACLINICDVRLTAYTEDAEQIVMEETSKELKENLDLVKFTFSIVASLGFPSNCFNLECKEVSC